MAPMERVDNMPFAMSPSLIETDNDLKRWLTQNSQGSALGPSGSALGSPGSALGGGPNMFKNSEMGNVGLGMLGAGAGGATSGMGAGGLAQAIMGQGMGSAAKTMNPGFSSMQSMIPEAAMMTGLPQKMLGKPAAGALGGAASGAMTGMAAGPWGAAAGGTLGLLSGLMSGKQGGPKMPVPVQKASTDPYANY